MQLRPEFELNLHVAAPPEVVWERLWDLDRHTAAVPLTTASGGPLGESVHFVARTGLGPFGFDDVMVVQSWEPPRRAVITKVGRVLTGHIEVILTPDCDTTPAPGPDTDVDVSDADDSDGDGRSLLIWRQNYGATGVPPVVAGLARPLVQAAYSRALRRIIDAPMLPR